VKLINGCQWDELSTRDQEATTSSLFFFLDRKAHRDRKEKITGCRQAEGKTWVIRRNLVVGVWKKSAGASRTDDAAAKVFAPTKCLILFEGGRQKKEARMN
jgi:hypothetical protein